MSGFNNNNRRSLVIVAVAAAAATSISLIPPCHGSSSSTPPSSSSSIDPRNRNKKINLEDHHSLDPNNNQGNRNHKKAPSSPFNKPPSKKKKKKKSTTTTTSTTNTNTTRTQRTTSSTTTANKNNKDKETSTRTTTSRNKPNQPHKSSRKEDEEDDDVVSHILKLTDYYELLNVSRTATEVQITKAYRRRAVQTHPDKMKNSDRRAFDKIAQAYDTLKDANKRSLYDKLGHNTYLKTKDYNPSSQQQQHHPFQDMFSNVFSTSPFSSSYRTSSSYSQMARNRPVRYQLDVTLEQLYTGTTMKMQRQKQFQSHASSSSRSTNVKIHEVTVPAGIKTGQTIRLSGEIDDNPHDTPADMMFVIHQTPHETFTRKGNDLALELTITLQEALCGFSNKSFLHSLSGKTLYLNSPTSNKIIKNADVHCIEGWGMPKRNRHHQRSYGDLYIQYKVELPNNVNCMKHLTTKEREQLSILLSKLTPSTQQQSTSSSKPSHYNENDDDDDDDESFLQKHERMIHPEKERHKQKGQKTTVQLKESESWKFGQSSNDDYEEEDEDGFMHDEDDHHDSHHPFSSFFGSSSRGFQYFSTSNSSRRHHSSSHPFFQNQFGSHETNDDGSNVQCQQM